MESKIPTDISLLSGTGKVCTPERRVPSEKRDMISHTMLPPGKDPILNQDSKSLAMLPQRKDPIPNHDDNRIINEQDPILPLLLEKIPTGYRPIFIDTHYPNKTTDALNNSIDNSCTDIDDYLNKLNVKKDDNKDDEYKDDNSQALNSNESVIKKLKHNKH